MLDISRGSRTLGAEEETYPVTAEEVGVELVVVVVVVVEVLVVVVVVEDLEEEEVVVVVVPVPGMHWLYHWLE